MAAGGVYVHLPFCPYVCPYCDFAKWRFDAAAAARYLAALRTQIEGAARFEGRTLFLGGGTPNTYAPGDVALLVGEVRRRFSLQEGAEVTIEVNPDLELCAGFDMYRKAGINRLSVGVQSLVSGELRALGRGHAPRDVAETVRRARSAGFENISLDLMFGAPGQSADSWLATLQLALSLDVEHISTYGLTIEVGTPYARWHARDASAFADDDLQADLYGIAIDTLTSAGFEQYEISNFARPGFRCAHNANYWANGDYLGLGVGAASYLDGQRSTTTSDLAEYESAAAAGRKVPAESERLEGAARVGEAAMLALRTAEGVDFASFAERYHVGFNEMFSSVLEELRAAGLVRVTQTHVALTRRGRFLANDVCAAFLVAA